MKWFDDMVRYISYKEMFCLLVAYGGRFWNQSREIISCFLKVKY
jgi:hypothetical protein